MHHATSPTTSPATTAAIPTFSSLLKTISPWSDDDPCAALMPLLRQLHSTLEVLHDYALYHSGPDDDPIYTHIVEVIGATASMANCSCEHVDALESKLVADSKQLRALAEQYGEEV